MVRQVLLFLWFCVVVFGGVVGGCLMLFEGGRGHCFVLRETGARKKESERERKEKNAAAARGRRQRNQNAKTKKHAPFPVDVDAPALEHHVHPDHGGAHEARNPARHPLVLLVRAVEIAPAVEDPVGRHQDGRGLGVGAGGAHGRVHEGGARVAHPGVVVGHLDDADAVGQRGARLGKLSFLFFVWRWRRREGRVSERTWGRVRFLHTKGAHDPSPNNNSTCSLSATTVTGSNRPIARTTPAKASLAGAPPSRQTSGRRGHATQHPSWASNSAGMRKRVTSFGEEGRVLPLGIVIVHATVEKEEVEGCCRVSEEEAAFGWIASFGCPLLPAARAPRRRSKARRMVFD